MPLGTDYILNALVGERVEPIERRRKLLQRRLYQFTAARSG
jgi:hypothetical protein